MPDSGASDQQIPQEPQNATEPRQDFQRNIRGSYYAENKMGENGRNINGHVGKTEGPTNWYEKNTMEKNGRNINGNFVNGADLKASGFFDN